MAQENVDIKVNIETKSAETDVNKLASGMDDLGNATKETNKQLDKNTEELKDNQKETKKSEKSTGGLLTVIKGLGIIGGITAAFGFFKEALGKNQKVADAFSAVMLTIQNVMLAVIEVITNVIEKVSKSTDGFDALGKTVKGLLTLALTPLKITFYSIVLAVQEAQYAWENSFFGDQDPKVLKALDEKITQTKKNIGEVGENAVKAGKDIYNNFGEAVKSVGDVIGGVVEGASEINVKAIYEQSKAITQMKNTAKLAEAEMAKVVKIFLARSEKLRQERDNELLSIEERIDANKRLGKNLEAQAKAMLALADQKIAAARMELSMNAGNVDLQVALKNAEAERLDVIEQIGGFKSEQLAQELSLGKELIALNNLRKESDVKLALDVRKANAERMTDELAKLLELQKIRDEERASELKRLQDNVNQYKEGTQARLDAEIALKTKVNELDSADETSKLAISKLRKQRELDEQLARIDNVLAENNLRKTIIEQQRISAFDKAQQAIELARLETTEIINQLHLKRDAEIAAAEAAGLSTIEIKNKYAIQEMALNNQLAQSEKDLARAKITATVEAADAMSQTLQNTANLFAEGTAENKALSVAAATISTFVSAQKAYEAAQSLPFGIGAVLGPISAGLAIAAGLKNVQKILAVKVPGDAGGGPLPSNSFSPLSPQAQTTTLNQGQVNQLASATSRAFVLESDVSGSQERIRRINRAARIN
jgi:hypothetical protein